MTDAPRAISATYHDWRTVKGRKQLQLIFEVPIEQQKQVLEMLGAPNSSDPKWCAIALMEMAPSVQPEQEEKQRTAFYELPPATQAAIRCTDPKFQRFIFEISSFSSPPSEQITIEETRRLCGVQSRSELSTNEVAATKWRKLESDYQSWLIEDQVVG